MRSTTGELLHTLSPTYALSPLTYLSVHPKSPRSLSQLLQRPLVLVAIILGHHLHTLLMRLCECA